MQYELRLGGQIEMAIIRLVADLLIIPQCTQKRNALFCHITAHIYVYNLQFVLHA
jgi:hypothetical protein